MPYMHNFIYSQLPYIALVTFIVGCIYRYRTNQYSYSSLSSQFLEGGRLFWGSVPFHFGILVVFGGHLLALLFPRELLIWNGQPLRLLILEITGFAFGLLVLFGIVNLFFRRMTSERIRVVTTGMDIAIEVLLILQVFLGCWIAFSLRWGSSWATVNLTPYIWSIIKLSPEVTLMRDLPILVQLHVLGAFLLLLIFPFTRLVHILSAPWQYLIRPYQQVIWNWDRKAIRKAETAWSEQRPKNN